jgi:hypothetical protein
MRTIRALAFLAVMIVFTGCWVLSIDPLYTSDDLVYEEGLVGSWGDPEGESEETWTFSQNDDKSYRLVIKEEGEPDAAFEAHLLRLDNRLYMDLFPEEPESVSEAMLGHLIPAHSFWTVSLDSNVLALDVISAEWLEKQIDSAKVDIDNIRRDDALVLTAHTQDLQAFVIEHAAEAFSGDPIIMKREH